MQYLNEINYCGGTLVYKRVATHKNILTGYHPCSSKYDSVEFQYSGNPEADQLQSSTSYNRGGHTQELYPGSQKPSVCR